MFYSSQLLSRKTALGMCWLASHLESKRLKRAQVFEVSIAQSCDSIINPEAPLALRLSGQLLLGVVRIYQRKLTFLETDAKNAIDGLQRKEGASQNVDLPDGGTAPEMAITLPDVEPGVFGGSELFPTFVVADAAAVGGGGTGGGGGVGLGARLAHGTDSLTYADDISEVLGSSRWTGTEERFDVVGGDDIDRRFSAELERLRSAAAVEAPRAGASDLFFDAPMDDSYGGAGGEIMEPPAEDLFLMPPMMDDMNFPTPGSVGGGGGAVPLPGTADISFNPPSLGGFSDGLPDVVGGGFGSTGGGLSTDGGAASRRQQQQEGTTPRRGRPAGGGQRKKKRVQIDVHSDGTAATQLPREEMGKYLNDRTPLLKKRGMAAGEARSTHAASSFRSIYDVREQSEAARESFMFRPACVSRLDPVLLSVFEQAMVLAENGKLPSAAGAAAAGGGVGGGVAASKKRSAANAIDVETAAEPFASSPAAMFGGADGGGDDDFGDGGVSPAPSWGGFGDGGADSDGYYPEPDRIETSQQQLEGDGGEGMPTSGGRGASVSGGAAAAPLSFLETLPRDEVARRVSLGGLADEETAAEGAADGGGGDGGGVDGLTADGFTARTKVVLDHLSHRFLVPSSGSKRRHPSSTTPPAPAVESVSLDGLVAGRPRLEACRWFFEALVLRNKGYVDLKQEEPYGEISITPLAKLMAV